VKARNGSSQTAYLMAWRHETATAQASFFAYRTFTVARTGVRINAVAARCFTIAQTLFPLVYTRALPPKNNKRRAQIPVRASRQRASRTILPLKTSASAKCYHQAPQRAALRSSGLYIFERDMNAGACCRDAPRLAALGIADLSRGGTWYALRIAFAAGILRAGTVADVSVVA